MFSIAWKLPFFFLKLQIFKYLDCGFLIQLFVFPGVSGYLLGTNAFITNSLVFPECIVIPFGLNKWSYHFLPGTSFPEHYAPIWTWLFPGAATQLSPCTVILHHSPGSHPQHPTSYSSFYQRTFPHVPSEGWVGVSFLWAGLSENAFMLPSFRLKECLIDVFLPVLFSRGI